MSRIFLTFQNAVWNARDHEAMPCYYESFIRGLSQSGNDLMVFHAYGLPYGNRPETTEKVRAAVKHFSPDVIFAFNNFGPDYSSFCDCPIYIIEVDSPLYYDCQDAIGRHPDRYRYFVVQDENSELLKKKFGVPKDLIAQIPFFSEVQAASMEKSVNISFVGSRFANRDFAWTDFRRKHCEQGDIAEYRRMLSDLRRNPFLPIEHLSERYPGLHVDWNMLNSAISSLSAEKRIGVLSNVADLGLELFGTREWLEASCESSDLYLSYNPKPIYSLRQNQDLYNRSKICINVNHLQAVSAFSWRVCDVMASSGCLVSEYRPNLKKLFPAVPIPTFENKFDAREQCKRILSNSGLREEISRLSQQAIDERYRFRHVLAMMEEHGGIPLRCPDKLGNVQYLCEDLIETKERSHHLSLALQCVKLAIDQIPGCDGLFNQKKLVKRIVNYTDYR